MYGKSARTANRDRRGIAAILAGGGGGAAVIATAVLPFHLFGGQGTVVGLGFFVASIGLAVGSIAFTTRFRSTSGLWPVRAWGIVGAAGFVTSGSALVADLLDLEMTTTESVAIVAVLVWWSVVGWRSIRRDDEQPELAGERPFGAFTLLCAGLAAAALLAQATVEPSPGAVPARFAYVLWGPWGIWLGRRLARSTEKRGPTEERRRPMERQRPMDRGTREEAD